MGHPFLKLNLIKIDLSEPILNEWRRQELQYIGQVGNTTPIAHYQKTDQKLVHVEKPDGIFYIYRYDKSNFPDLQAEVFLPEQ